MVLDLFSKTALPSKLPKEMKKVILKLKHVKNKEVCLRMAYDVLCVRSKGYYLETWIWLHELFISDIDKLWHMRKMHCTNLNYVLRVLLVNSGWFTDDDIELKWTLNSYISPHQYLCVKIGRECINVDPWGRWHGITFGHYAYGFGQK